MTVYSRVPCADEDALWGHCEIYVYSGEDEADTDIYSVII
jgi:hypothetical protein